MSTTPLFNIPLTEIPPSVSDQRLLALAFGSTRCNDSSIAILTNWLAYPIIATLIFILLAIPAFDGLLATLFPDYVIRLAFKALLFFILILLLDRLFASWRNNLNLCS